MCVVGCMRNEKDTIGHYTKSNIYFRCLLLAGSGTSYPFAPCLDQKEELAEYIIAVPMLLWLCVRMPAVIVCNCCISFFKSELVRAKAIERKIGIQMARTQKGLSGTLIG